MDDYSYLPINAEMVRLSSERLGMSSLIPESWQAEMDEDLVRSLRALWQHIRNQPEESHKAWKEQIDALRDQYGKT